MAVCSVMATALVLCWIYSFL